MKLITFTTVFIVFLVLIFPGIITLGIRFIPYGIQPPLDRVESIHGYQVISQEFVAEDDRLTGFAMSLKNPYLRNKKDIILSLYDGSKEPIRMTTLNGSHIEDGAYVKFVFPPINDSKNKKYNFVLSALQANTEDSLQVFYTAEKQSNMGILKLGKDEVPSFAVSLVSLYKPASIFASMGEIYNGWISRLIKDTGFFMFYLFLLISLGGYLILSLTRKAKE